MKPARRRFLGLVACVTAVPGLAAAQTYPARPVRIIVGFAPGGLSDILARLLGQWLTARLGQQFVVENRAGTASNLATELVVRAPSDGYTLLIFNSSAAINQTLPIHKRYFANRCHHERAGRHGGEPLGASQDSARVHRLCQG